MESEHFLSNILDPKILIRFFIKLKLVLSGLEFGKTEGDEVPDVNRQYPAGTKRNWRISPIIL